MNKPIKLPVINPKTKKVLITIMDLSDISTMREWNEPNSSDPISVAYYRDGAFGPKYDEPLSEHEENKKSGKFMLIDMHINKVYEEVVKIYGPQQ